MFKSNILMTGRHAQYLKKYSVDKQAEEQFSFIVKDNDGNEKNVYIFETMIQAYMVASMIGIIEGKSVPEDKSVDAQANMFAEVVNRNAKSLRRIVQMMILSSDSDNPDQLIKDAFTIKKDENELKKELTGYARAGLEIINEIFSDCYTYEDVGNAILELQSRYALSEDME